MTTIMWFRQDLRLHDNPALHSAVSRGDVIPLYIWDDSKYPWKPGAASQWWLHHSLAALDTSLRNAGSRLILRTGNPLEQLFAVIQESKAVRIHWNRCYEPYARKRDEKIKTTLKEQGIEVESFNGSLLFEPWEIQNKSSTPYQVFTPFCNACLSKAVPRAPEPPPSGIRAPEKMPFSEKLDSLRLLPRIPWDEQFYHYWKPGEQTAISKLDQFRRNAIALYSSRRDLPGSQGTSQFSPHLHFGEISPRQIWHACINRPDSRQTALPFLRQIAWREFAFHLLYHYPDSDCKPLKEHFSHFPWSSNTKWFNAWKKGQTGYPLVDAGMRELWTTGWMHNRVRMVVASFLVKHLLIPWQQGAEWFWDTLVDADLPNNTMGWQWTAGCGADAAPFFRIFNPMQQGKRFDPEGAYIRKWIPEIGSLPDEFIHEPWQAGQQTLTKAGIKLGSSYPFPIVDHQQARNKALEAYAAMKKS
ncbi:MAG: deoxyribodipyrimidine photo-lyase [Planctomycetia bacterium]|nr:deoxyribodipyrimidine photo-lyase [Planctomycetia bacterium]